MADGKGGRIATEGRRPCYLESMRWALGTSCGNWVTLGLVSCEDQHTTVSWSDVITRIGKKRTGEPQNITLGTTGLKVTGFKAVRSHWTAGRCVMEDYGGSGL